MSMRMSAGIVFLVLAQGLAGCSGSESPAAPSAPSLVQPPVPPPSIQLVVFTDPLTGLTTSDVGDLHSQIVRFDSAGDLIWAADDTHFPRFPLGYGYERGAFEVLFGTENGERRAYLTFSPDYWHYPPPASRVDLEVMDGKLVIRHPDPPVFLPGT
jgi:hypothetical protein